MRTVALRVKEMKFTLPKAVLGTQVYLLQVMEDMRTEIQTLREDVKRLKQKEQKTNGATDNSTCPPKRLRVE